MSRGVYELLSGVDLFSSLDQGQIQLISRVAIERHFTKDQDVILESEDGAQGFFLIAQGELEVYLRGLDGKETILSLLGPGDFFGEMSLLDNEPRSASVKAIANSVLYQIRRDAFIKQLREFPELSLTLLAELSRRLRKANRQIGSLATMTVYGRVASTLLNLAEDRGTRIAGDNGQRIIHVRNRPTQQQLAEMSGTTRETVSRILMNLRKKGIIEMTFKDLFILKADDLRNKEDES